MVFSTGTRNFLGHNGEMRKPTSFDYDKVDAWL